MIEIYDRAEFKDKFAHLMAADISLMQSGIDPKSDIMSRVIDAFLDQFKAATPARAETAPYGWIIRDRWDNREIPAFAGVLYESEEVAIATIEQAYTRPDFNEFNLIAVY